MATEITQGSDRAAVILSAAYTQHILAQEIIRIMPRNDPDTVGLLYDRDGPLNTFASTIHLAYAMGLIDADTCHDLGVIRRLRNAFAHSSVHLTFETPALAAECAKLKTAHRLHLAPNASTRHRFMMVSGSIRERLLRESMAAIARKARNERAKLRRLIKKHPAAEGAIRASLRKSSLRRRRDPQSLD